ncbi:MAG: pyrroline-5-carboxylate reductase [Gammaproteobacteria bacterium]|jgi:pyrroline-5-carboxylate reductase|nr:pyrroline-5-carboxylate reductase [Gammaproteobacteria bacterium]
MQHQQHTIGFIGGGNMAQAIVRGLLKAGHPASRIMIADPAARQRELLGALHPDLRVSADNATPAASADLLVLAVKPQQLQSAIQALVVAVDRPAGQVVMSIAAGITLRALNEWFGGAATVIRVMPNTPALVGAGMAGLYAADGVPGSARDLAAYAMGATGRTLWLDNEGELDLVTAVSGSGPAYFFLVMEALQEIGTELGLSPAAARLLATQTALGAGLLAAESDDPPATLRARVTSPGGTTAAAIAALEAGGIRDIFRTALIAARDRSRELGA